MTLRRHNDDCFPLEPKTPHRTPPRIPRGALHVARIRATQLSFKRGSDTGLSMTTRQGWILLDASSHKRHRVVSNSVTSANATHNPRRTPTRAANPRQPPRAQTTPHAQPPLGGRASSLSPSKSRFAQEEFGNPSNSPRAHHDDTQNRTTTTANSKRQHPHARIYRPQTPRKSDEIRNHIRWMELHSASVGWVSYEDALCNAIVVVSVSAY